MWQAKWPSQWAYGGLRIMRECLPGRPQNAKGVKSTSKGAWKSVKTGPEASSAGQSGSKATAVIMRASAVHFSTACYAYGAE